MKKVFMDGKAIQFYQLDKNQSILNTIKTFMSLLGTLQNESMNDPFFRINLVTVLYQRNASTSPGLVDKLPLQPVT